jgi:WD40 repeat protein
VPAPDGKAVASFHTHESSQKGDSIRFRDLSSGHLSDPIAVGHGYSASAWRPPGGGQFATAGRDGVVRVWDRRTGELVIERQVAHSDIGGLAYGGDGQRLMVSERSGRVFELDAETLQQVGLPVVLGETAREVFTGPDPDRAVVLLSGGAYAIVDLAAARKVERIDLGTDVTWLDLSPDGTRLAVATTTGRVGLADVESGKWIQPPTAGHKGWVQRVSFAPDGSAFVSSGNDGHVRLWDGRTGAPLAGFIPDQAGDWTTVEFLPDNVTVVIADRDGGVYAWDTRPEHWIEQACSAAGRNLTKAEWHDTFGNRPFHDTCPAR